MSKKNLEGANSKQLQCCMIARYILLMLVPDLMLLFVDKTVKMAICRNNYITLFSLVCSRMLCRFLATSPDWSRKCNINVYRELGSPRLIRLYYYDIRDYNMLSWLLNMHSYKAYALCWHGSSIVYTWIVISEYSLWHTVHVTVYHSIRVEMDVNSVTYVCESTIVLCIP